MSDWSVSRGLLEDQYQSVPHDVEIILSELVVDRGDTKGEIRVRVGKRWVLRRRLTLSGDRGVASLAKELGSKAGGIPWAELLDRAVWETIDHMRAGEPGADLWPDHEPEPPGWAVRPFWSEAPTVLFAPPKSGKSYMALALAAEIATGHAIVSEDGPQIRGPVAIYDWEADRRDQSRRLWELANGHQTGPLKDIIYHRVRGKPLRRIIGPIVREIEREGIVAIVIDSMGKATDGAPESAEASNQLWGAIDMMGVPVLAIHHVRKADNEVRVDQSTPFGSMYTVASARLLWRLDTSWDLNGLAVSAYCIDYNYGPKMPPQDRLLTFGQGSATWTAPSAVSRSERAPAHEQLAALLRERGAMRISDAAKRLDLARNTLNQATKRHAYLFDSWMHGKDGWVDIKGSKAKLVDPM